MTSRASTQNKRGDVIAISLGTALFVWIAGSLLPALRMAENWVSDLTRATLAPAPPFSPNIALVTITEETLATFPYRSPVNRNMLAEAVDKIAQSGAKGLAFDILFDQPTEAAADERLYIALRRAAQRMPVVVAFAGDGDNLTAAQAEFLAAFTDGLDLGVVNLPADPDDGVVRWFFQGKDVPGIGVLPGLPAALAGRARGTFAPMQAGTEPLAYARGLTEVPSYPLHTISLLPPAWLKDKFLLVGSDLPHSDLHRTPLPAMLGQRNGLIPGVAIHAHALNQSLSGIRLHETPPWMVAPIGLLLALLSAIAFGLKIGMVKRAGLGVGILGGYAGLVSLLAAQGVLLPLVSPLLAVVVASAVKGGREWRKEQRQSLFVQDAFSRYLSPAVVRLLMQDPARLKLGGEQREITFVFTDLAGFTSISEKLPPETMAEILNGYLERMCRIAIDHEATIDKIVGDAVVVFFNAPLDQPGHAQLAVRLALAYDAFSESFRDEWRQKSIEIGITRVGVNTGRATVGNFGGQRFFNYTCHGDAVNTAARLESVNKHLGTRICISGETAKRCPDLMFRPIGTLTLMGKTQGLDCFEPLSGQEDYAPLDGYLAAFKLMEAHDLAAKEAFAKLAAHYPGDPLARLHAARLAEGETGVRIVMLEK